MPKIHRFVLPLLILIVSAVAVPAALAAGGHHHHHKRCHVGKRHHHMSAKCRRARRHRHHKHHKKSIVHGRRITGTGTSSSAVPLYWGASVGTQFTGSQPPFSMAAERDFANKDAGGKNPSLVSWGSNFYSSAYCSGYCNFTTSLYDTVRNSGQIPWISWQSTSTDGGSGYTDQQIANGSQDSYITRWAQAAKAWGHPLFLRFDWEMNGSWFRWSAGQDGNTASSYVAMWRHVHDIFASVGANNVSWVWCPNIDPGGAMTSLSSLYPGDSYVNWTCLDGYNSDSPWRSFDKLFQSTYDTISGSLAPSKPMIIGEVGSTEAGGSKATWIQNMFDDLASGFSKVHGFLWYDVKSVGPGGHTDWPIESSSSSISAFTSGVASSSYEANAFSGLTGLGVPVPSSL